MRCLVLGGWGVAEAGVRAGSLLEVQSREGSDDLLATGYRRLVIANMRQSLVVSV